MLSCKDVREVLPDVVLGETSSEALREHVAACEACRAERERLQDDVAGMRRGLAALTPSPLLEEAVEYLAAEEPGPVARSRGVWWPALAAAAVLVLVAVLERRPVPGPGVAAGDPSAPTFGVPPSVEEIADARRRNALPIEGAGGGEPIHRLARSALRDRLGEARFVDGFPAPEPGALHRWTIGRGEAAEEPRSFEAYSVPAPGEMMVGAQVLERLDAMTRGAGGQLVVHANGGTWRPLPGGKTLALTVSAPYEDGPSAEVRVVVSTAYAGSLLLEEPIGRALDLHHFELPGGYVLPGHEALDGHRALARVRIPDLDFDEVIEVQVRGHAAADLEAPRDGTDAATVRVVGTPDAITVSRAVRSAADERLEFTEPTVVTQAKQAPVPTGPYTVSLAFTPRDGAPWTVPSLIQTTSFHRHELLSTYPRILEVRPLEVQGPFAPGARLVLARVWRGDVAVPSREGVTVASVPSDGGRVDRVVLPRLGGEAGGALRMLVTSPDGSRAFRDVVLDTLLLDEPRLHVRLDEDGRVHVRGTSYLLSAPGVAESFVRDLGDVMDLGLRGPGGLARATLVLDVSEGTSWGAVLDVVQVAAMAEVPDLMLAGADAAPLAYRLPGDRGLEAIEGERPAVRVLALDGGEVAVVFGGGPEEDVEVRVPVDDLAQAVGAWRGPTPGVAHGGRWVELEVERGLPYALGREALRGLLNAGWGAVGLSRAP